jgi:hypothetical protein
LRYRQRQMHRNKMVEARVQLQYLAAGSKKDAPRSEVRIRMEQRNNIEALHTRLRGQQLQRHSSLLGEEYYTEDQRISAIPSVASGIH